MGTCSGYDGLSPSPLVRRTFAAVAAVLLLALTWFGVSGGVRELPQAHAPAERIQSVAQLSYGVLSLLYLLTSVRTGRGARLVLVAWVVSLAIAAGLAPVVWGQASVKIGLASAAIAALLAFGIVALLRAGFARGSS